MKKIQIIIIMLFLGVQNIVAQKVKQVSVMATTEAIGLPFTNYAPIHPGIEASITFARNEQDKSVQLFNAKAGSFYHRKLQIAVYLGGEYQYSRKLFKQKISLDFPIGLGYFHTFYPGEIYEQNGNGDFERVNQFGRPHLYINLGIGLTYIGRGNIQPFIRQEALIQTPFANGIPVIPHSLIKIGVNIKFGEDEN
ncbi:hypothetical protein SAMN05661096_03593 [Marivirga sericea]|uniref:Outer membrane protein beta-barrel domain-containing protein n=1 Tax=Marivirga sericea TaxID=1028 RepID=A0A1X7L6T2_9BACT|nr:hypothetical protein [Marivirga sericea]SMG49287.1 hypothetical protein SAMN05661096_03593 [Marivirga sericea]